MLYMLHPFVSFYLLLLRVRPLDYQICIDTPLAKSISKIQLVIQSEATLMRTLLIAPTNFPHAVCCPKTSPIFTKIIPPVLLIIWARYVIWRSSKYSNRKWNFQKFSWGDLEYFSDQPIIKPDERCFGSNQISLARDFGSIRMQNYKTGLMKPRN